MIHAYRDMITSVIDETRSVALGLRMDGAGAALDCGVQWTPDGEFVELMPGPNGEPTNHLARFNDKPFLFATSMDMRGINVAELFNRFTEKMPEQMMMGMGQIGPEMWKTIEGMSMVAYPSPAGLMGGLYNSAAQYYAGDPKAIRAALKETFEAGSGQEQMGVTINYEYTESAKEVAGQSVDSWSMSIEGDPQMKMQMEQGMTMMFGPAGPGGYIAEVEGGVLMTMSRNTRLLESGIESAKNKGGLAENKILADVNDLLSPNPSAVSYLGVGAILEQASPFMAMFMPGLEIDQDQLRTMPPLAGSLSFADRGMQASFAVPAPTVKTGIDIAMKAQRAMQQNQGGMGGEEDDEPEIF